MRKRSLSLLFLLAISGCASFSGSVPGRPAQGALVADESKTVQLQKLIKDQQELIKLLEEKIAMLEGDLKKSERGHQ